MLGSKLAKRATKDGPRKKAARAAPKRAVPKKTIPRRAKPKKTILKKAKPKKSISKRAKPKKAIPKRTKSKRIIKKSRSAPRRKPAPRRHIKSAKQKRPLQRKRPKPAKKQKKILRKRQAKESVAKRPRKQTDIDYVQQLQQPETPEPEKRVIKYPVLPGGDSERIKMLLPILRDLVKKGVVSDWVLNFTHNRGANIYVQRNGEAEDELSSIREDIQVIIYERYSDGSMGEARIPIITNDPGEAKQQVLDAKTTCASTKKPWFPLPEPQEGIELPRSYDERMLASVFEGNGAAIPRAMHQQVRATMQALSDVKMNCCELHASAGTVRVISSTGVDISFHKTIVYLEVVMTCRSAKPGDKSGEREYTFNLLAVSPEQLDIQAILLQQAQIARDATTAEPNPGFVGDVVLSGRSVTEFFAPHHDVNPLVLHTSAKIHHMGLSCFTIGQPIGQFTSGEPITISTNPGLPLGLYTMPVDEDGTPLSTVELVRNGLFVNYLATARYAHYLGVPPTGNLTNVHINPGATREEHLRGNNYFEIVSFSWFNPNPLSGDFSAEIRLAYRWVDGRKTPVRGGMFTGNVFTNILAARFSKEIMQSGAYYGPRAVLFKSATINRFE